MNGEVEQVYQKYMAVFHDTLSGGEWVGLDAVRFGLRAALHEMAACPPVAPGPSLTVGVLPRPSQLVDQRHHEWLNAQIERLNEWLAEHAPARYHDASDTADSVIAELDTLRGQAVRLRVELAAAIGERDAADVGCAAAEVAASIASAENATLRSEYNALRASLLQLDAHNAQLSEEIATLRGQAAAPKADSILLLPVEQAADILARETANDAPATQLDDDLRDWIIGLDTGRHTWRTIPKPERWRLIVATLRSIWRDGRLPSMENFNAAKPEWMPIATSIAASYGDGKWTTVCGKAAA